MIVAFYLTEIVLANPGPGVLFTFRLISFLEGILETEASKNGMCNALQLKIFSVKFKKPEYVVYRYMVTPGS